MEQLKNQLKAKKKKNDKIHKSKAQEIRWSDENYYRVAANIAVDHIILKFIFLRIIIHDVKAKMDVWTFWSQL